MTDSINIKRRDFIVKTSSAAAAVAAAGSLAACSDSNDEQFAAAPEFNYGVASGDPLTDRIMLWTHAKFPGADAAVAVPLTWQISTDANFSTLFSSGKVEANDASGFTAKVDAAGLTAGVDYFYRLKIYRSFDFGSLFSLHMLDTRIEGRDQQYDNFGDKDGGVTRYIAGITPNAAGVLPDASRRMISTTQQSWLTTQLTASRATWQILGNQDIMAKMWIPFSVAQYFNPTNANPTAGGAAIQAYLGAKAARAIGGNTALTTTQSTLLDPAKNPRLPYNLDSWDGTALAPQLGSAAIGAGLGLIDDLNYADTIKRGYLAMTVTANAVKAEYIYVSTVKSASYTTLVGRTITVDAAGDIAYG